MYDIKKIRQHAVLPVWERESINTKETKGWLTLQPFPDSICFISVKLCLCYMMYDSCDIIVTGSLMIPDGMAPIWN